MSEPVKFHRPVVELEREVERLREALKFYANESNWDQTQSTSVADKDYGKIARATLGYK